MSRKPEVLKRSAETEAQNSGGEINSTRNKTREKLNKRHAEKLDKYRMNN